MTSSDLELQRLLASTELDHAFYVQSPAKAGRSSSADSQQLLQRSMAWAIRAHTRAGQTCRASIVMPASLSPADAGALGLARTLFMEQRALCGPALFLDTTGPPMSQQVTTTICCSHASQDYTSSVPRFSPAFNYQSLACVCHGVRCAEQVLSGLLTSKEYVVSHSHSRLMTQRLIPGPVPAPRQPCARAHGSVLVTGGSKGLGLAYAKHAAAGGLQSLVIAARSPELPLDMLIALAEQGTPVWTVQYVLAQADAVLQKALS